MTIDDFCCDYCDSQVFFTKDPSSYTVPDAPAMGLARVFWSKVVDQIVQSDPAYGSISRADLESVLVPMRLELFSLALYHYQPDASARQSLHLFLYLNESGREDVWDAVTEWNAVVSNTCDISSRAQSDAINKARVEWSERQLRAGHDDRYIYRVANRIGTKKGWQLGKGPKIVADALSQYLKRSPTNTQQVAFSVRMLYEGSWRAMEQVELKV